MNVRLAKLEDVPALKHLIQESVRGLSTAYYSPQQIESALHHVFGVDSQLIRDETYFIAETGGQVAGAGGWSKRKTLFGGDQSKSERVDLLLDPATEPARIRAFYIHPNWSRRGIGTRILQACEDGARASGFARVELASTLPGVPFYLSRGYEKENEIPIEMADGELLLTIRMSRKL
jgi:GNAT superfamily N-acetyltransferase